MKSFVHRLVLVAVLAACCAWTDVWDELPKSLLSYEPPLYPLELRATAVIDGYATVAFTIDDAGQVDDAVVLEASHSAFGVSVLDALPYWHFEPASAVDSLPRREVLRFEFASKGVVASVSHRDAIKAVFPPSAQQRMPIRTLLWKQLPTPPERLSAPAPVMPNSSAMASGGKVAVSFIIDTSGRVRVPFIVNATRPELGLATLMAVKQWQFSPPMYDGAPVLVEDTRSFTFGK
jgi:TonB family protein